MAKEISIDNGATFESTDEFAENHGAWLASPLWDSIAQMMDDEIREQVHSECAPCTNIEFLRAYLERAEQDLVL